MKLFNKLPVNLRKQVIGDDSEESKRVNKFKKPLDKLSKEFQTNHISKVIQLLKVEIVFWITQREDRSVNKYYEDCITVFLNEKL